MRKFFGTILLLFPLPTWAGFTGAITPTSVTYHFTSANLMTMDQKSVRLIDTDFDHTFSRTDADFASEKLEDVTVPFGRYSSISICFKNNVDVKLNGVVYHGPSGTGLSNGDTLYTVNTNGDAAGAVTHTAGTVVAASHAISATLSEECMMTYFKFPLCIADSTGTGCNATDEIFTAAGKLVKTGDNDSGTLEADLNLELYILVDMFNSVAIDGNAGEINNVPNPIITIGKPGAAIHLMDNTGNNQNDMSFIFNSDKSLVSEFGERYPMSATTGNCRGSSFINVTAVPTSSKQSTGINFVGTFDSTGMGTAQTTTANSCTTPDVCVSHGINVTTGFLQTIGNSATVNCIADSAATPPYLGYTYTGGTGQTGSTSLPIARIVDPANLFSICPSGDSHAVSGHTGTCSAYNTSGDGYQ